MATSRDANPRGPRSAAPGGADMKLTGADETVAERDPAGTGTYSAGVQHVVLRPTSTGAILPADIYFPAGPDGLPDPTARPYPTLVFAHGLASRPSHYSGWGRHLASWGYVSAFPHFLDDNLELRCANLAYLLSHLQAQGEEPGSALHRMVDGARLGVLGHSTGGITALMLAARDPSIKVVVGLDPADPNVSTDRAAEMLNLDARHHLAARVTKRAMGRGRRAFERVARISGRAWDYTTEGPSVRAPVLVLTGRPEMCNVWGYHKLLYPALGSAHQARYIQPDGRHCDFMDTTEIQARRAGYLVCFPPGRFSPARLQRIERYTTAWLNYYLCGLAGGYTYLFGASEQADEAAGLIHASIRTAVRGLTATTHASGEGDGIALAWDHPGYPAIAGYNVYRGIAPGRESATLLAQTEPCAGYLDQDVTPGQGYYYAVYSRDAAGNEHQLGPGAGGLAPGRDVTSPW
jgi:dienelactone hydrolase